MLIGAGTFALFTASASNTGNTFTAGDLGISLDQQDPNGEKYFTINNMAPGDTNSRNFIVTNTGSLELRYDIAETLTGDLAAGPDGLKITIKDADGKVVTPGDNNIVLAPKASNVYTVTYELPKTAGNWYMDKTATLGITVNAEQTANNPLP